MKEKAKIMAQCLSDEIARIKSMPDSDEQVVPVFVHASVDGDCIGSACSVTSFLRNNGIKAFVALPEKRPDNMDFLDFDDLTADKEMLLSSKIPLVIAVDCSAASRMGIMGEIYDLCDRKLIIDHHQSVKLDGEGIWVEPSASSASEMVFYVLREYAGLTNSEVSSVVTKNIAQFILTGIVTDTGRFTYSNTEPQTLATAGELMTLGAEITPVCYNLFDRKTEGVTRLIGYTLSNADVLCDGKLAIAAVSQEDFDRFSADDESIGAIVTELRDIDTVEVAFVLRETSNNKIRVNIRSKSYFDCSGFAEGFGGGGHKRAAGMSFDRSLPDTLSMEELAKEIVSRAAPLL
ncbi:MAG: DHH family phosphoesterase [Clostridia bacterium]|nr:DHH family phosphoesterase [Clostridia bacterium]